MRPSDTEPDDEVPGSSTPGRRRGLYRVVDAAFVLALVAAVVDLAGAPVVGVDHQVDTVRSPDGTELRVVTPEVSRPGLASPFQIEVTAGPGGFDGAVRVGVTQEYLDIWDLNGISPSPDSESSHGEWVVWEFTAPSGRELLVHYDGRVEPAMQSGRSGSVALFDGDRVVAVVDFHTRVLP